jgi:hypothetical protein
MIDISRLEQLIDKASPLPWIGYYDKDNDTWWVDNDGSHPYSGEEWSGTIAEVHCGPPGPDDYQEATASLIAEGISALPELLQELKELRKKALNV